MAQSARGIEKLNIFIFVFLGGIFMCDLIKLPKFGMGGVREDI